MNSFVLVLIVAAVLAGIWYLIRQNRKPQTRVERKLAKLAEPAQPIVTVTHGAPRMSGRPRLGNILAAVAELGDHRPTVETINTMMVRSGLTQTSVRLVRRLIRRLVKRGLVIRLPMYPGAPSHQQVYCYADAPRRHRSRS